MRIFVPGEIRVSTDTFSVFDGSVLLLPDKKVL